MPELWSAREWHNLQALLIRPFFKFWLSTYTWSLFPDNLICLYFSSNFFKYLLFWFFSGCVWTQNLLKEWAQIYKGFCKIIIYVPILIFSLFITLSVFFYSNLNILLLLYIIGVVYYFHHQFLYLILSISFYYSTLVLCLFIYIRHFPFSNSYIFVLHLLP